MHAQCVLQRFNNFLCCSATQYIIISNLHFFRSLHESYSEKHENKIKCIVHYFKRICSCMPVGYVSFERKVLPLDHRHVFLSYPEADFWSKSVAPLCPFEVHSLGSIEDQSVDAVEVDFANKYIGGGALHRGCVQLCSYASSFRFAGDHVDKRNLDISGRRKTRIVAIDALCMAGMKQYALKYLLQYCQYERLFQDRISRNDLSVHEASSTTVGTNGGVSVNLPLGNSATKNAWHLDQDCRGIATGNWGCGASGGDPELKTIIQWLAASQALQPFTSHYTFGIEAKWVGFGIKTERVARLFYYELRVLAKSASRSRSTSWRNLNQSLSNFKLLGNRQVDVGIN